MSCPVLSFARNLSHSAFTLRAFLPASQPVRLLDISSTQRHNSCRKNHPTVVTDADEGFLCRQAKIFVHRPPETLTCSICFLTECPQVSHPLCAVTLCVALLLDSTRLLSSCFAVVLVCRRGHILLLKLLL